VDTINLKGLLLTLKRAILSWLKKEVESKLSDSDNKESQDLPKKQVKVPPTATGEKVSKRGTPRTSKKAK
jgi:hypothetical protein